MSETNIYTKLLNFQKANVSIQKGKTNPHFKSKYADINEVLDKVKPVLSELGVVVTQLPTETGLKTILHDTESGTEVEGFIAYTNTPDPQKLGSHITYYRRYALVAMLGLEDEDDDGNSAKPQATVTQATVPKETGDAHTFHMLRQAKDMEDLKRRWDTVPAGKKADPEVIAVKDEMKDKLTNQETVIEA